MRISRWPTLCREQLMGRRPRVVVISIAPLETGGQSSQWRAILETPGGRADHELSARNNYERESFRAL